MRERAARPAAMSASQLEGSLLTGVPRPAATDRVGNGYKDNGNCLGRFFQRCNDWGTLAEDAVAL